MARDNEDFSAAHASTIAKWTRDKERKELSAEHSEKQTTKAIANMLKSQANRVNIARDLKRATENTQKFSAESGFSPKAFGETDDPITGVEPELQEQLWNRDIDE